MVWGSRVGVNPARAGACCLCWGARGWRQSGTLGRMLSLRGSGSGPWGGVSGAVVMRGLMGGESNPCAM